MDIRNKVLNMSMTRRLLMAAAFAAGLWNRGDLYMAAGSAPMKNDSVAYRPKHTKFKGWQRQAREGRH